MRAGKHLLGGCIAAAENGFAEVRNLHEGVVFVPESLYDHLGHLHGHKSRFEPAVRGDDVDECLEELRCFGQHCRLVVHEVLSHTPTHTHIVNPECRLSS